MIDRFMTSMWIIVTFMKQQKWSPCKTSVYNLRSQWESWHIGIFPSLRYACNKILCHCDSNAMCIEITSLLLLQTLEQYCSLFNTTCNKSFGDAGLVLQNSTAVYVHRLDSLWTKVEYCRDALSTQEWVIYLNVNPNW